MSKNLIASLIVASTVFAGCTSATQPIASEAISRGVATEDSIVNDLSTMVQQSTVDREVAAARQAASSGSPAAAQSAVENTANDFEKVGWLKIQHERARSLIRVGQTYVWSQKGIINIMIDEAKQAKKNAAVSSDPKMSAPNPNRSLPAGGEGSK